MEIICPITKNDVLYNIHKNVPLLNNRSIPRHQA